ncbi:MAG: ABC transporter ATP-binding protein [Chloroflexi bacterium]|nr:ABC transporter ATP-binding protein [Chloroflexota bacterium]
MPETITHHPKTLPREIVRVHCVRHVYEDKTEVNLCGLDMLVHEDERVAILGSNGSGKTTLLYHLVGLLRPLEGDVHVFGIEPHRAFAQIRERVGVVLQNVDAQIVGPTVYDDIAFSPRSYGFSESQVGRMVQEMLAELRIAHLKDRVPHYLSGGEKKKVALAGALVFYPQLLILDEPFTGLDPQSRDELMDILNHFNQEHHLALVVATHDVDLVPRVADRAYVLSQHGIVAEGTPAQIFAQKELLRDARIEAPILAQLLNRLDGRDGEDLPLDVDGAAAWIKKNVTGGR